MKRLTAKEEEIMEWFWEKGPLFVKELQTCYDEPRPHFNTLSTFVRGLEDKGFLAHHSFGNTYRYFALITAKDYGQGNLRNVIAKYFDSSYLNVVSSLIKEEDISVEDLRRLLDEVEQGNQKS
ncbi:MAG: BlaI/MecI/CopY family transcriptional regulator [Tannerellaceae bacterium]|jgi:predicted transcriptional regulator|nr:BlaI/MecI/CopY family transcriptional regulator [Tannerellaceae bacterium]